MIKCQKCGTEYTGAERFCPKDGARLGTGEMPAVKLPSIPPEKDPLINKVIQGRYKVLAQIGEGGMGVVYVAEHVEIEKKVALKVLRDDFSKRPEVVARFRQEARSAGKIGNAHIVDVTDFGQLDNGGVYFVMEYLQGRGLNEVIRKERINVKRAANIVLQIAQALKAAHKLGIVHRDLKPENIYLIEKDEEKEYVKILDFGIAKISDRDSEGQRLTKTGMIFGTPEYMSPEQASGKPLDNRVDIYALGCIMFEMFTGRVPFEGETFMAVLTQHMFEPVPRIESICDSVKVPESVKAVVYKAMAKEMEDRYSDMMELADDLERAMADIGDKWKERSEDRNISSIRNRETVETGFEKEIFEIGNDKLKEEKKRMQNIIMAMILVISVLLGVGIYFGMNIEKDVKNADIGNSRIEEEIGKAIIEKETEEKNTEIRDSERKDKDSEEQKIQLNIEEDKEKIIKVEIETVPKDSTIIIEGMGQVCSVTPCIVEMEAGRQYEIEANNSGNEQRISFTPSENNRELEIKLVRKTRKNIKKNKSVNEVKKDNEDGLKIPNVFKIQ